MNRIESSPTKSQDLPEYCQFFKPLLVEHFSLVPSPLDLHYGKCALIGRTSRDEATRRVYLDSTRLIGLEREYQCPDGSTRVLLHTAAGSVQDIAVNETVRLYGEAVLFDSQSDGFQMVQVTSKELRQTMAVRKHELETQETPQLTAEAVDQHLHNELETMGSRYVPCFSVHNFSIIDQPHELLQMQLKLLNVHANRTQTRITNPWW